MNTKLTNDFDQITADDIKNLLSFGDNCQIILEGIESKIKQQSEWAETGCKKSYDRTKDLVMMKRALLRYMAR